MIDVICCLFVFIVGMQGLGVDHDVGVQRS